MNQPSTSATFPGHESFAPSWGMLPNPFADTYGGDSEKENRANRGLGTAHARLSLDSFPAMAKGPGSQQVPAGSRAGRTRPHLPRTSPRGAGRGRGRRRVHHNSDRSWRAGRRGEGKQRPRGPPGLSGGFRLRAAHEAAAAPPSPEAGCSPGAPSDGIPSPHPVPAGDKGRCHPGGGLHLHKGGAGYKEPPAPLTCSLLTRRRLPRTPAAASGRRIHPPGRTERQSPAAQSASRSLATTKRRPDWPAAARGGRCAGANPRRRRAGSALPTCGREGGGGALCSRAQRGEGEFQASPLHRPRSTPAVGARGGEERGWGAGGTLKLSFASRREGAALARRCRV